MEFSIRLVADTPEKREKGLMFSRPLDEREAALFVFSRTGDYSFWNKNVSYGLSLAFLDDNGKIIRLADMEADNPKAVSADSQDVRYVVEAQHGAFKRTGINEGDIIVYTQNHSLQIKKSDSSTKNHR
jgi:uncharacterized membrane protein (UPF0127 family)